MKINLKDLLIELADLATKREMCDNENLDEGDGFWELVYKRDDYDNIIYTESAQQTFNNWWGYYNNTILKHKI